MTFFVFVCLLSFIFFSPEIAYTRIFMTFPFWVVVVVGGGVNFEGKFSVSFGPTDQDLSFGFGQAEQFLS